ncbi:MAG: penicillin-binding protein [Solobacterium sp.]|nr:penicillin-binding protein [Solobacterium sp.]
MKKILFHGFIVIVLGLTVLFGFFILQGKSEYQAQIQKKPLAQAVEEHTSKEDYVLFENISMNYVNAVVAVEDQRYYTRTGFDWIALIRATINNFILGENVEGGSTISQQIAKNLYYVGKVRTIKEKIAEVFMMLDLERMYSKDELIALYANIVYYGDGYYGIKDASNGYLKKDPSELSIAEGALLAGLPNAPSAYQLSTAYDLAINRQQKVLSRMLEEGYISEEEYHHALQEIIPRP